MADTEIDTLTKLAKKVAEWVLCIHFEKTKEKAFITAQHFIAYFDLYTFAEIS